MLILFKLKFFVLFVCTINIFIFKLFIIIVFFIINNSKNIEKNPSFFFNIFPAPVN